MSQSTESSAPKQYKLTVVPIDTAKPELELVLKPSDVLFLVGRNGSGKSALLHFFMNTSVQRTDFNKIPAHRQTWLTTDGPNIQPSQVETTRQHLEEAARYPQSRTNDNQSEANIHVRMWDFIGQQFEWLEAVAAAPSADEYKLTHSSPMAKLNNILTAAALGIQITYKDNRFIVHKEGYDPYGFSQLSDGERAVILLGIEILSLSPNKIFFIDEPEKHLHHSIIRNLIPALIAERPDCVFVISTYDVELPIVIPRARVILVRDYKWEAGNFLKWDVDLLPVGDDLPEELKRSILGSRRRILFTEGDETSPDALYQVLFPKVSVVSKGGNRQVIEAVRGLKNSPALNWIEPLGLIDRDYRNEEQIKKLEADNIYALSAYSVEALYYGTHGLSIVAGSALKKGASLEVVVSGIVDSAIASLQKQTGLIEKLAAGRCYHVMRQSYLEILPKPEQLSEMSEKISLELHNPITKEIAFLKELVEQKKWDAITQRYRIKGTPVINAIIQELEFESPSAYEARMREVVATAVPLQEKLKSLLSPLSGRLAI